MPIPETALTIPVAAEHVTFSQSTLRNYVRAWEECFYTLPTDWAGRTLLVLPLLELLTEAHALWPTALSHEQRIATVLDSNRLSRFLGIADAYRRCASTTTLRGIEELCHESTKKALLYLAHRIDDLDAARAVDKRQLEESTEEAVNHLLLELSDLAAIHAKDLNDIARAVRTYALRMEMVSDHVHQAASGDTTQ